MAIPHRGEVWELRRNAGGPPHLVLVVSDDNFNALADELALVLFLTDHEHGHPMHVRIDPPNFDWREPRWVQCENLRTVQRQQLLGSIGLIADRIMDQVERHLRSILRLYETARWVED